MKAKWRDIPRCITISGLPGSPTAAVAQVLAKLLGWTRLTVDDLPSPFQSARSLPSRDGLFRIALQDGRCLVLEGLSAGWFAREFEDVLSIFVESELQERVARLAAQGGKLRLSDALAAADQRLVETYVCRLGFDPRVRDFYDVVLGAADWQSSLTSERVVAEWMKSRSKARRHEQRGPAVGAGLVIVRRDKVLLARRLRDPGKGTFGCCGGKVEMGETIEQCLRREAIEEFGVRISKLQLLAVTNIIQDGHHYFDLTFRAALPRGEHPTAMEPDKIEPPRWYALTRLPAPLFEPIRNALSVDAVPSFSEVCPGPTQLRLPAATWIPSSRPRSQADVPSQGWSKK
jgi:8-oxo-dGTP diphosphatase